MAVVVNSTLYDHYTTSGIDSGLSANQSYFTLNEKNITLYSGAMHYFRVPQEYWRDRLKKMRAAGLNTVETYVPWNLHEPQIGSFDFGKTEGKSDFSHFLDIEKFLKTAQEEDLFAIVRPGPYICSEWEFGGLPSWLLREDDIKVRTSDNKFMQHVRRYFSALLHVLTLLQFTKGGPIIAFQIENEYGSTYEDDGNRKFFPDKKYLQQLEQIYIDNGIKELLFTSDAPSLFRNRGTLPHLFQTANFDNNPEEEFGALKKYQQNRPFMAMEFWGGWFDHWAEEHNFRTKEFFGNVLQRILTYPASVNIYMFHGGTNWGFMNGANIAGKDITNEKYQPDTTSYDYDAPLTEAGDYTAKYFIARNLIEEFSSIKTKPVVLPREMEKVAYSNISIESQLSYKELVTSLPYSFNYENVVPMELLPINNNSGQSYGYIIYRKLLDIPNESILKINGHICDVAMVLIDGELISGRLENLKSLNKFGFWKLKDGSMILPEKLNATLDIVVINLGRNNYGKLGQFAQFKGLRESVYLNNDKLTHWTIMPMEFKSHWIRSLTNWSGNLTRSGLTLNRANLIVENKPKDTFIDMSDWNMGIVVVNDFVLGRYMHLGPQQTLYLPAPLLRQGSNSILVFEYYSPESSISFSDKPIILSKNCNELLCT